MGIGPARYLENRARFGAKSGGGTQFMINKTPLNEIHRSLGARMVEFAGGEGFLIGGDQWTELMRSHLAPTR